MAETVSRFNQLFKTVNVSEYKYSEQAKQKG